MAQRVVPVSEQINYLTANQADMDISEKPQIFCSDTMVAHLWLSQYNDYSRLKSFTDEKFVSSFSTQLNQKAQKWFYNLPDTEKRHC